VVPNKRLRVAHVISTPSGLGGAERFLIDLVEASAERGTECVVLNPFEAEIGPSALSARLLAGVYRSTVTRGVRDLPRSRRWLAQSLADVATDIVHVHLFHATVLTATCRVSCPLILTHHHGDVLESNGRRIAAQLDRLAEHRYTHLVAVSERVRDFLVQRRGVAPARVSVIANGWTGRPRPRSLSDVQTVICVANFRPEKQHDQLLAAFRRVLSEVPTAQLRLVGSGPEEMSLRALVESDRQLSAAVTFVGALDDVWTELAGADAFVLSSRYEGMSVALLEALAAGVPAVVTDVGASRVIVEQAPAGFAVVVGDIDGLAGRLVQLLTDPQLAAALSKGARETALHYTFARTADRYHALYDALTSEQTVTR
jgi:glycosyltransferase involved in cell wall biosynthesis